MSNINRNVIGTALYPQSYNSDVDTSKLSYSNRLSSGVKYYLQAWMNPNNQICLTLKDRKVVSTGVTEEMIKKLGKEGHLPDNEMQLVQKLVQDALGEPLFSKLSKNDLIFVSKLLSEPGEHIDHIKKIVDSPLHTEKLNLLDKYPSFFALDSDQLDKLVNIDEAELNFLVAHLDLLKNLKPAILEKILSFKADNYTVANQIITLLNIIKSTSMSDLLQNIPRLTEILNGQNPVADLEWMVHAYHA